MMRGLGKGKVYIVAGLLAACLVLPLLTPDIYLLTVIGSGLLFGILAMSLDLLWGYSGILNLAPALSFGIGAYSWGIVSDLIEGSLGTLIALVVVLLLSAGLAAGVAFVSFRSGAKEIYFALITLALTLALQQIAMVATDLTGGSNGLLGISWPAVGVPGVFEFSFDTPVSLYYLAAATAAAAFWVSARVVAGRFGKTLRAIRESDLRAETLGYSTLRHRVTISAVSAALAAVAGMLYAPMTGIVDPSVFGAALSIQVFVWVAIGGAGTLVGPFIAALLLTSSQATLSGSSATVYLLVTGVGFVLIVLFLPGGLASLGSRFRRRQPQPVSRASAADESAPRLPEGAVREG
jgi:ABC-type branched-subunit amino acid transport system permease subunit